MRPLAILGIDHDRVEPLLNRGPQLAGILKDLHFKFDEKSDLEPSFSLRRNPVHRGGVTYNENLEHPIGWQTSAGWVHSMAAYSTWLFLPLIVKGELIGCLVLAHSQPDRFDSAERTLAQGVANQAAIAMENARLYRQAQEAAVTSERMRLARDLHDSVTQALYTIKLYVEASTYGILGGKSGSRHPEPERNPDHRPGGDYRSAGVDL